MRSSSGGKTGPSSSGCECGPAKSQLLHFARRVSCYYPCLLSHQSPMRLVRVFATLFSWGSEHQRLEGFAPLGINLLIMFSEKLCCGAVVHWCLWGTKAKGHRPHVLERNSHPCCLLHAACSGAALRFLRASGAGKCHSGQATCLHVRSPALQHMGRLLLWRDSSRLNRAPLPSLHIQSL